MQWFIHQAEQCGPGRNSRRLEQVLCHVIVRDNFSALFVCSGRGYLGVLDDVSLNTFLNTLGTNTEPARGLLGPRTMSNYLWKPPVTLACLWDTFCTREHLVTRPNYLEQIRFRPWETLYKKAVCPEGPRTGKDLFLL